MAIDPQRLPELLMLADAAPSVRAAATVLRETLAPLRVVVVDAFDMRGETPAAQGAKRTLWWGASDGHCWSVTAQAGQAAGVFLADRA